MNHIAINNENTIRTKIYRNTPTTGIFDRYSFEYSKKYLMLFQFWKSDSSQLKYFDISLIISRSPVVETICDTNLTITKLKRYSEHYFDADYYGMYCRDDKILPILNDLFSKENIALNTFNPFTSNYAIKAQTYRDQQGFGTNYITGRSKLYGETDTFYTIGALCTNYDYNWKNWDWV